MKISRNSIFYLWFEASHLAVAALIALVALLTYVE